MKHAFICKLLQKFPLKSTLLSDLRILNHERTTLNDFPNIVRLAQHFPQLVLGDKLDALRTEALDFQMASLPTSTTGKDVEFWASIHNNIHTVDTNQPIYSTIHSCAHIRTLLALPASNADSER